MPSATVQGRSPSRGSPRSHSCPDEPCPFAGDTFPVGRTSCCSLRGESIQRHLCPLGYATIAVTMDCPKGPDDALAFAVRIRAAVDTLERKYAGAAEKPKGAALEERYDDVRHLWNWIELTPFEEATAVILQAADWYEKVGRLGYGVHALHLFKSL